MVPIWLPNDSILLTGKKPFFRPNSSGTLSSIKWIFTCNLYFIICSSLCWYRSILISFFYDISRIYQYKFLICSFLVLFWLFMSCEFIINFNIYLSILIYINIKSNSLKERKPSGIYSGTVSSLQLNFGSTDICIILSHSILSMVNFYIYLFIYQNKFIYSFNNILWVSMYKSHISLRRWFSYYGK